MDLESEEIKKREKAEKKKAAKEGKEKKEADERVKRAAEQLAEQQELQTRSQTKQQVVAKSKTSAKNTTSADDNTPSKRNDEGDNDNEKDNNSNLKSSHQKRSRSPTPPTDSSDDEEKEDEEKVEMGQEQLESLNKDLKEKIKNLERKLSKSKSQNANSEDETNNTSRTSKTVVTLANSKLVPMLEVNKKGEITRNSVQSFVKDISHHISCHKTDNNMQFVISKVDLETQDALDIQFQASITLSKEQRKWRESTPKEFCENLLQLYPAPAVAGKKYQQALMEVKLPSETDINRIQGWLQQCLGRFREAHKNSVDAATPLFELPGQRNLVKLTLALFSKEDDTVDKRIVSAVSGSDYEDPPENLNTLFVRLTMEVNKIQQAIVVVNSITNCCKGTKTRSYANVVDGQEKKKLRHDQNVPKVDKVKPKSDSYFECNGCGRTHGSNCILAAHPNYNKEDVAWSESANGKKFASGNKPLTQAYLVLPWDTLLTGAKWPNAPSKPVKKEKAGSKDWQKQKRKFHHNKNRGEDELTSIISSLQSNDSSDTVPCSIIINGQTLTINAFIDNGATQANYVSDKVAAWLSKQGVKAICDDACCRTKICSAFNECRRGQGDVAFELKIVNEINNTFETIKIISSILNTKFDLIIGRRDIKRFELANKLRSQFFEVKPKEIGLSEVTLQGSLVQNDDNPNLSSLTNIKQLRELIDRVEDDDHINWNNDDYLQDPSIADQQPPQLPTQLYGTPEMKQRLQALCEEFHDVFSTELKPEPALLPPLELTVNEDEWHSSKNRTAPRMQSAAKAVEIRLQLNKMVANAVVTPSQADAWSQVLLTPKPNQKWRLCIDYRRLNDSTKSRGWPIPNVKEMLNRVGTKRAKYFGVIDLTSGYHQAPLGTSSRGFTAFMTVMGLFEWLRVPMGLKGAPAYFQQMMITIVLVGIYMAICEVYMDDILVFAKTEDEFITNCRTIFKRLRKHKLTANPTKTRLAMHNAEYVGHVIDEQGLTFSKEKIDSVANFKKTENSKTVEIVPRVMQLFSRSHKIPLHTSATTSSADTQL